MSINGCGCDAQVVEKVKKSSKKVKRDTAVLLPAADDKPKKEKKFKAVSVPLDEVRHLALSQYQVLMYSQALHWCDMAITCQH